MGNQREKNEADRDVEVECRSWDPPEPVSGARDDAKEADDRALVHDSVCEADAGSLGTGERVVAGPLGEIAGEGIEGGVRGKVRAKVVAHCSWRES